VLGGVIFSISALVAIILFIRQEKINRELRLRISDLEWLQLSKYHEYNITSSSSNNFYGGNSKQKGQSLDLSGINYKKDIEDIENVMNEMEKILEQEDEDEDADIQMILQMINKHQDNTVLDDNLVNIISTPSIVEVSSNSNNDNVEIKKNTQLDIKDIEETLMSSINDEKSEIVSNTSFLEKNLQKDEEVDDIEWISDSYTLQELKDLCKKFNLSNKGSKKELIKRLLENNMDIPKKMAQHTTSS
jgi:hypothetical protein